MSKTAESSPGIIFTENQRTMIAALSPSPTTKEDLLGFSTLEIEKQFYTITYQLVTLQCDLLQWTSMFIDAFVYAIAAKWAEIDATLDDTWFGW